MAKELTEFVFDQNPVNETLVRDLHGGGFLETKRNAVLIGGTGSGKTHLAIAIAANCVRKGARARFFTVVDLVNRLEAEMRAGNAGKIAEQLSRIDLVVLDELGYLPFPRPAASCSSTSSAASMSAPRLSSPPTSTAQSGPPCSGAPK